MKERLSICYAAPGHSLVPTSGTTRNILSLAKAMAAWADVTVAFRNIPDSAAGLNGTFGVETIDKRSHPGVGVDDEATRGVNPLSHLAYLRTVREYARQAAGRYDVVLEKGWRLSGYLVHSAAASGAAGAVIENDARCWTGPRTAPRDFLKWLLHSGAQRLAGSYSGKAPIVIAETEELRQQLYLVRGVPLDKIRVVPLGVDHALFRPIDQNLARQSVQIAPEKLVLLYVGGMDKYHDLSPLLEALAEFHSRGLELHIVGEGEFRPRYEQAAARSGCPVVFHGRVPHERVPFYIGASDLCLAPYCAEAFHDQTITFSTLKIPEYMACARPVASIPSGEIKRLIQPGINGFLLPNSVAGWSTFLPATPTRTKLSQMGQAAFQAVEHRSWEATARGYLQAIAECGYPTADRRLQIADRSAEPASTLRNFR
ncbi:MAG: glycosyltransferase [Acidobacteria bacterium]|nr:MAG: glycosyltransferase [Acidobacteriota bacterium]